MQKELNKNEINLINMLEQTKINNLNKQIELLSSKLHKENNKQENTINKNANNNILNKNNDLCDKIFEMRENMKSSEEEIYNLKKEIQKYNNYNEELQILLKGKEEIIEKLKNIQLIDLIYY